MPKVTVAQMIAAICCVRGSFIRGTLRPREIVAKDRTASEIVSKFVRDGGCRILTNGCNYLSFNTKLVREATSKVGDSTSTIACHVWHLSDVVIHVAAGEHQDQNQTQYCPQIPVLNDWEDVGICHSCESEDAYENRHGRDELAPIERPNELRIVTWWKMSLQPTVDALRSLRT